MKKEFKSLSKKPKKDLMICEECRENKCSPAIQKENAKEIRCRVCNKRLGYVQTRCRR